MKTPLPVFYSFPLFIPPFMTFFSNTNLFKITFLFLIFIELFSFFGWLMPELGSVCFFIILFLTLILSLCKLEYGLYIIFAELFIGSKGYLFSFDSVSIRIGLFLVVMTVFLMQVIKKLRNKEKKRFDLNNNFIYLFLLVIIWGFIWGIIRGNNFGDVFLDFNNWLYFLLIFPILDTAKNSENFIKNILSVLFACVIWIGIKSLFLLYIFSHQFVWALPEVYKWVRDTGIGEITSAGNGFYRIFIQSQIYSLLLFFILLPEIFDFKFLARKNIKKYLLLAVCLSTVILSFSRSYWVALVAVLLFYYFIILLLKTNFLDFLKLNAKIILVAITSFVMVFAIINFPPKIAGSNLVDLLGQRASETEAAASSRINQLKPLLKEIAKHPLVGSGFGTTATYVSDDPRIKGEYTTYAFEWGYFDMILKFGLVGLGIYLYIIYHILRKLFNFKFLILNFKISLKSQIQNNKNNYPLQFGFGLALVALLITNIFSPYLNHPLGIGFIILSSLIIYEK
ncbi:MAG: O-antigen ligase family protein [Patescibacteria group bacterium]